MEKGFVIIQGVFSVVIGWLLGGWDAALQALVLFMAVDYATGLVVAGVFKNSTKTDNGAVETRAGLKGLIRKVGILVMVMVVAQLELILHDGIFCRNVVVIFFIINEALSILENLGLMGVKYPDWLKSGLEVLLKKSNEGGGSNEN